MKFLWFPLNRKKWGYLSIRLSQFFIFTKLYKCRSWFNYRFEIQNILSDLNRQLCDLLKMKWLDHETVSHMQIWKTTGAYISKCLLVVHFPRRYPVEMQLYSSSNDFTQHKFCSWEKKNKQTKKKKKHKNSFYNKCKPVIFGIARNILHRLFWWILKVKNQSIQIISPN